MALTKISRSLLDTGVSDSSDATAITIDSSENVGIGCTDPQTPLEIDTSTANYRIQFTHTGGQNLIKSIDSDHSTMRSLFYDAAQHVHQVSGTTAQTIDSAGIVTKPLQPYFLAYRSGNQTGFNSSGDFGAVVQYNAEVADINGDFNTSTGLFTCPVDGTYWFIASAYGSSFQQAWLVINAGSGASRASYTDFNVGGYSGDVFTGVFYVNLDANDTVGYHPYTSTSTSVTINANANHTWFKGGLLY